MDGNSPGRTASALHPAPTAGSTSGCRGQTTTTRSKSWQTTGPEWAPMTFQGAQTQGLGYCSDGSERAVCGVANVRCFRIWHNFRDRPIWLAATARLSTFSTTSVERSNRV